MNALLFVPLPILYITVSHFMWGRVIERRCNSFRYWSALDEIGDIVLIAFWPIYPFWILFAFVCKFTVIPVFLFVNRLFTFAANLGKKSVK